MLEAANVLKERSKSLAQTLKKDAYQDQKIFLSNILSTLETNTFKRKSELIKIFKKNDIDYLIT